jgi:AcrR family transcriptional regulator
MVAHPGHELRLHGWLEMARPVVFVLTDGSGRSGKSRLYRTSEILNAAGARPGSIYGRYSDVEVYRAILERNFAFFFDLTEEFAGALLAEKSNFVVGDSIEGYNPVHDVCRLVINGAVTIARKQNHPIENYDFVVVGAIRDSPDTNVVRIELDSVMLEQKLAAAHGYSELDADVSTIVADEGVQSFKNEYLRPVDDSGDYQLTDPPFYEVHGEAQVAAGFYDHVLRYREHMLPLAQALTRFALTGRR